LHAFRQQRQPLQKRRLEDGGSFLDHVDASIQPLRVIIAWRRPLRAGCSRRARMLGSARIFQPESTGTHMPLDRAAGTHIATLARSKGPEEERGAMAKGLAGIVHGVEELKEVDPSKGEPMTGAVRMALPRRKDEITAGDCRDKILANGPETAHGFFVVPKVV